MTNRREFMLGSTATVVAAGFTTPTHAIPVLAAPETLVALAAQGKYASSIHELPEDVFTANFSFKLNGVAFKGSVSEIYAPGDDTGWAVVYMDRLKTGGWHTGATELIPGRWEMKVTRE